MIKKNLSDLIGMDRGGPHKTAHKIWHLKTVGGWEIPVNHSLQSCALFLFHHGSNQALQALLLGFYYGIVIGSSVFASSLFIEENILDYWNNTFEKSCWGFSFEICFCIHLVHFTIVALDSVSVGLAVGILGGVLELLLKPKTLAGEIIKSHQA